MKKALFMVAALVVSAGAMASDCADYLNQNLDSRIKRIESRLGYFRFNPSYYTNVPSGWLSIKLDLDKECTKSENKSKDIDEVIESMSIKAGMKKS